MNLRPLVVPDTAIQIRKLCLVFEHLASLLRAADEFYGIPARSEDVTQGNCTSARSHMVLQMVVVHRHLLDRSRMNWVTWISVEPPMITAPES